MKKIILSLALVFILSACQSTPPASNTSQDQDKKTVTVTTTFLEDMVGVLAGDYVNVDLIIPAGEDPHMYLTKPQDMQKISHADLLLYHGLHFEGKMIDVLEQEGAAVAENFAPADLGMVETDGVETVDPHFWFDIDLYKLASENAAQHLIELLPENQEAIEENLANYLKDLDALKEELGQKLATIPAEHRYLITPHDAFNYFSKAFDIPVMAPQGISTDSEVANREIEDTANFIVEKEIKSIFIESTTNPDRMQKLKDVVQSKGFDVQVVAGEGKELFSDSLAPKGQEGDNYLDMYRHNVDIIVENLK